MRKYAPILFLTALLSACAHQNITMPEAGQRLQACERSKPSAFRTDKQREEAITRVSFEFAMLLPDPSTPPDLRQAARTMYFALSTVRRLLEKANTAEVPPDLATHLRCGLDGLDTASNLAEAGVWIVSIYNKDIEKLGKAEK